MLAEIGQIPTPTSDRNLARWSEERASLVALTKNMSEFGIAPKLLHVLDVRAVMILAAPACDSLLRHYHTGVWSYSHPFVGERPAVMAMPGFRETSPKS